MMKEYNWKQHFAGSLIKLDGSETCQKYQIKNETGEGRVTVWSVQPGIQVVYTDLHMLYSSQPVKKCEDVIQINYCVEGRYECDVNSQYSFFVSAGDFSVGAVGHRETGGNFPIGYFSGISFFLDLAVIAEKKVPLLDLEINLDAIRKIASTERRLLVLHGNKRIEGIFHPLVSGTQEDRIPLLRLKTMELLLFLSNQDMTEIEDRPVYQNKTKTQLAKSVRRRITEDLKKHITLAQLSEEFQVGMTTLKTSFKGVYGVSIYAYQKTYRLQEARQMLLESKKSVAEIAMLVGYINPGKFTAAFKEAYGMTPSEYVNRIREGKEFRDI